MMNQTALLSKLHDYFHAQTNGVISADILRTLPSDGPIIEQLKKMGFLDDSADLIHEGKKIEAIRSNDNQIIDVAIDGVPLLNIQISTKNIPRLIPIFNNSCEIIINHKTYKFFGIDKANGTKLKATIRLELSDKLHIDTLNFYQSQARSKLVQELCQTFHIPVNIIMEDVNIIIEALENFHYAENNEGLVPCSIQMSDADRQTAMNFGQRDDLLDSILSDYESLGYVGEQDNKLLCYLTATSRLFSKPLSSMVISSSGAGKSALVQQTLCFMPDESTYQLTSLSAKALFYKGENSLQGKILSLEEDKGADNASYAIRQLISSNKLTVEATIRDQLDGKIKTQTNTVKCQTAVFITSTNPDTDPETKSRFFILHVDESEQQTARILQLQKDSRSLANLGKTIDREAIITKHQNFQRILKPYHIVNPYVEQLQLDSCHRLTARRNFPKYLTLIDTICLIRQFQKEIKHHNGIAYLEVDSYDMETARRLFTHVIDNSISELNSHSRELLSLLKSKFTSVEFTRKDIRAFTNWSFIKVRRAFEGLMKHELLTLSSGGRGKVHSYKLV